MLEKLACTRFRYVMSFIVCAVAVAAYCVFTPARPAWTVGSGVAGGAAGFFLARLRRARLDHIFRQMKPYLYGVTRRDVQ